MCCVCQQRSDRNRYPLSNFAVLVLRTIFSPVLRALARHTSLVIFGFDLNASTNRTWSIVIRREHLVIAEIPSRISTCVFRRLSFPSSRDGLLLKRYRFFEVVHTVCIGSRARRRTRGCLLFLSTGVSPDLFDKRTMPCIRNGSDVSQQPGYGRRKRDANSTAFFRYLSTTQFIMNGFLKSQGYSKAAQFDPARPSESLSFLFDAVAKRQFGLKINSATYIKPAIAYLQVSNAMCIEACCTHIYIHQWRIHEERGWGVNPPSRKIYIKNQ
jgi:hypothetical protein